MGYLALKLFVTASLVVAISEIGKRSTLLGALLASLPLVSVLAFTWIYVETGDRERVAVLSTNILWLILPSLVLFVVLPLLLRGGWGFWPSLAVSAAATATAYLALVRLLARAGIVL